MHWLLAELGRQIGATVRRPSRVPDIPAQLVRRRGRWRRYIEDFHIRRAVGDPTNLAIAPWSMAACCTSRARTPPRSAGALRITRTMWFTRAHNFTLRLHSVPLARLLSG
jgi:hypothetical protein